MADVSYVPGTRVAVAGNQCWALAETPPDAPAVSRTWQRAGQGAAADALLAGLLDDGLAGTPGFTLLTVADDGLYRLFCRGTLGATIVGGPGAEPGDPGLGNAELGDAEPRDAGGTRRVDGAGLLTWRELAVPEGTERIFLGDPPSDTELRLPATAGVLLASCLVVDLTSLAVRETVPYGPGQPPAESRPDAPDAPDSPGRPGRGRAAGGQAADDRVLP